MSLQDGVQDMDMSCSVHVEYQLDAQTSIDKQP